MVLKLFFNGTDEEFIGPMNKEVNGFVMKLLGENNPYHGKQSNYCVSSLQGGKLNENGKLVFKDGGSIRISSNETKLISQVLSALMNSMEEDKGIGSLKYDQMKMSEYKPFSDYDIIRTISPIYLRINKKAYTVEDEDYIKVLQEHCINKLLKNGVDEKEARSIKLEPFHFENSKKVCVPIGKVKNISSKAMFIVRGKRSARRKLYNLGLGISTGFGFGCVEIKDRKID